jgi:nicotinate-nucleotide pyrophosphorylase (carboxylating)
MPDLRKEILKGVAAARVYACIVADEPGIVAETTAAAEEAERLGLSVQFVLDEGTAVAAGDRIIELEGTPECVARAEEVLMGLMAKASGIATAASRFVEKAGGRPEIVCGAWKKMPPSQKDSIRRAIVTGGARFRVCGEPFIYLDKNYIEMLGGIGPSLEAVARLNGHARVVQLKGRYGDIADEACEAAEAGADVLSIDTGRPVDVERAARALVRRGLRDRVRIAFAGGIHLGDLEGLKGLDVDIVDVGREVVDAPLLDMRMEVLRVDGP